MTSNPAIIAQRLMADDLDALCAVFAMLLGNMPPGVVYCLIDGAHWYDTEGRRDDTRAAMRFLGGLVMQLQNSGRGLALKVLVTGPGPRQCRSWALGTEEIDLEQRLLTSGHRGIEAGVMASAARGSSVFGGTSLYR